VRRERVLAVQRWAEISRLYFVEKRSKRAIHWLTGYIGTRSPPIEAETPPWYVRAPSRSKLDAFKDRICEQLQADASIPSLRLREMAAELG
jgi:hypothetical protein